MNICPTKIHYNMALGGDCAPTTASSTANCEEHWSSHRVYCTRTLVHCHSVCLFGLRPIVRPSVVVSSSIPVRFSPSRYARNIAIIMPFANPTIWNYSILPICGKSVSPPHSQTPLCYVPVSVVGHLTIHSQIWFRTHTTLNAKERFLCCDLMAKGEMHNFIGIPSQAARSQFFAISYSHKMWERSNNFLNPPPLWLEAAFYNSISAD